MTHKAAAEALEYRRVELDGVTYVIIRERVFVDLCAAAGIQLPSPDVSAANPNPELDWTDPTLAEKLAHRRRAAGLSQAELARRAGIRHETLNRIERGRTTPDFATIRKLVVAMNAAEQERETTVPPSSPTSRPET